MLSILLVKNQLIASTENTIQTKDQVEKVYQSELISHRFHRDHQFCLFLSCRSL